MCGVKCGLGRAASVRGAIALLGKPNLLYAHEHGGLHERAGLSVPCLSAVISVFLSGQVEQYFKKLLVNTVSFFHRGILYGRFVIQFGAPLSILCRTHFLQSKWGKMNRVEDFLSALIQCAHRQMDVVSMVVLERRYSQADSTFCQV